MSKFVSGICIPRKKCFDIPFNTFLKNGKHKAEPPFYFVTEFLNGFIWGLILKWLHLCTCSRRGGLVVSMLSCRLKRCGFDPGCRILMEAKCMRPMCSIFRCTLRNLGWFKFPKPSTTACLELWFWHGKKPSNYYY